MTYDSKAFLSSSQKQILNRRVRNLLCSVSLSVAMGCAALTTASAEDKNFAINLPAQSASASLKSFAKQVGAQIIYPHDKLSGVNLNELVGSVSVEQGLHQLLDGTGLAFRVTDNNVIVITSDYQKISAVAEASDVESDIMSSQQGDAGQAVAAADEVEEDGGFFEEIIVTATKRSRRLQDVPLAISAIGERQLERLGADGFEGYYRTVPGLNFNQGDANRGTFSIRGISTSIGIGENQSPVAIYVDELPTDDSRGGRTTQDLNLFDVERVEVLRGPQGTLFGSGALGGAIRIITNKPNTSEVEGKVEGDVAFLKGGDATYTVKGMVNLPVVQDKFAIRAVGFYKDTGGFVDNVANGEQNVNTAEAWGGRVAARLDVNEDLSLTATVSHQKTDTQESASLNTVIDGERVRSNPLADFSDTKLTVYNFKADYDFGAASVMSSTTYSEKNTFLQQSLPGGFPIIPGVWELDILAGGPDKSDSFAQEVRVTSADDGDFRWVLGAFYFKRNRNATSIFEIPGIGGLFGSPSDIFLDANIEITDKEKALYGELSYDVTEKLEATVGLRWFGNDATYRDTQTGLATGGLLNVNEPEDHNESKLTPKFVLSYKPTDDAMIYASAAKGYRIGGTNVPIPVVPSPPAEYGPDSLWNYELGFKTSWLDSKLILNVALYYIDWTDIQIELEEPITELTYTSNGGQAHSKGVEVEIIARPADGLQLMSSFSWNNAEMDEDVLNPDTGVPFALNGDRMPGAREFTISNSIEYTRQVSEDFDLFIKADHQYVGSGFADFGNIPSVALAPVLESYTLVNLRAGLTSETWDITLYADNLFNNEKLASLNGSGTFAYRLKPRVFGLNVRTEF